ncbi:MAG: type III-B CRISPR module RAMP protein Cmr6 [Kiritimatiellia bacterium]|jgi:CRISPR-associated protein Cmr6
MPVHMATDTKEALGATALKCESRPLFMDKFPEFAANEKDETTRRRFLEAMINKSTCRDKRAAFIVPGGILFTAVLGGRMIVNQAGGVIENAGLCLDRHTGEPYIPGSALKGIAAAAARDVGAAAEERALVFGFAPKDYFSEKELSALCARCPDMKKIKNLSGAVAFLPAYPKSAQLELDILTCHHMKYYAGEVPNALDNEQPNPQVFPVVKAGAEFTFQLALTGPNRLDVLKAKLGLPADFNPLARAAEWLKTGLQDRGVGAKTATGYGWFSVDVPAAGAAPVAASTPGAAPVADLSPDFNERNFKSVLRIAGRKGEWANLQKIIVLLKKPENRYWLEKFLDETKGRDHKELRARPWYPKPE